MATWLLLSIAATVVQMLLAEALGWFPRLGAYIVRRAARRLPASHRERYEEEWLAELAAMPGAGISALVLAVRIRLGASRTRRALSGSYEAPALKRLLDVSAGLLATVVLAPNLLLITLALKLQSNCSPALARTVRVGRGGRPVHLFCFVLDRDGVGRPRTALGRMLRGTGLDLLPRFLNVVRGDLALVGPPPLPPDYALPVELADLAGRVRPGLTSWWALALTGHLPEHVAYQRDLEHLGHWTLRGELRLLWHTMLAVLNSARRRSG